MKQSRRAGRWLLVAALGVAPAAGCKNGFQLSSLNPFDKSSNSAMLESDGDGYVQSEPPPVSSAPAEISWSTTPFKKFGEVVSSPFKKTASTEKPKPRVAEDDPVALTSHTAPPEASLYISLAKLQEKAGNTDSAIEQYGKALEIEANNLEAQLGLARLYDRQDKYDLALTAYRKAVADHPESAAAHNDLGLCYARSSKFVESVGELKKAVALESEKPLYRNNLATVLVELKRYDEAYQVLVVAHGDAAAHYNLGFLLNKRGNKTEALAHFKSAVAADPSLKSARQWIDVLNDELGSGAGAIVAGRDADTVRSASGETDSRRQPAPQRQLPPAPTTLPRTEQQPLPLPPVTRANLGAAADESQAGSAPGIRTSAQDDAGRARLLNEDSPRTAAATNATVNSNRPADRYEIISDRYQVSSIPARGASEDSTLARSASEGLTPARTSAAAVRTPPAPLPPLPEQVSNMRATTPDPFAARPATTNAESSTAAEAAPTNTAARFSRSRY